jgi:hypothetical protein
MNNPNAVRRFEVEPVDGKKNMTIAEYDKEKGGGFKYEVKKEEFGYMVYFPAGHSIRVRDMAELRRLGYDKQPGLVDLESGEVLQEDMDMSPKAIVNRKTRQRQEPLTDVEE